MLGSLALLAVLLNFASGAVKVSKPQACGPSEEFRRCGPAASCVPTCDNQGEQVCCVVGCTEGCFCVDGYIRDHNKKCVAVKDCPSAGLLKFEKLELVILENAKIARLTVLRINGSHGHITVRWKVQTSNPSYSTLTGLLVFEDGIASQFIDIPVIDNDIRDSDITLIVELFEPSRKTGVEPRGGSSTITIQDDDMRPGYPEMDKLSLSVKESDGSVSVRVVRVGGTDGRLTASWKTVGGTAQVKSDFIEDSGQLVFGDGVQEKYIKIKINNDEVRETKEQFRVEIYDPTVGAGVLNFRNLGSKLSTIVTIEDDDMTPGYPEMPTRELRVMESDGTISIKVVRKGGTDGTITVKYRIIPGTALLSSDFMVVAPEGVLVFAEGVSEQTISVFIFDDNKREKEEKFRVELFEPFPGPGTLNFRNKGTSLVTDVVILDNDMRSGYLQLERTEIRVLEGLKRVEIFVLRLDGFDGQVSVLWQTRAGEGDNAALASVDFETTTGRLIFLEGETRKSFVVNIFDDNIRESPEEFLVDIFNASAAVGVLNFRGLGQQVTTKIFIEDDDMKPGKLVLEQSTLDVLENSGIINVAVNRVDGTDGQVLVHWRTIGEGSFFEVGHGILVFQEGESRKNIEIRIIDNQIRNREKRSFQVELFEPSGPPGVDFRGFGEITRTTINVNDDDVNVGRLKISRNIGFSIINHVPTVTATIQRFDGADGRIFVKWRTVSTLTTFVHVSGDIIFEEGETEKFIQIPRPLGDFDIELINPRPGLQGVSFRGLGEDSKVDIKLNAIVGNFSIEERQYHVSENIGTLSIGIVRDGNADVPFRVQWRLIPRTAVEIKDFEAEVKEIVFLSHQHLQFISIHIKDDTEREADEYFEVELVNVFADVGFAFNGFGAVTKTVVTIIDNDKNPGVFSFMDSSVIVSVGSNATLKVVRTGGADGIVELHYRSTDGDATREDVHYRGAKGTLHFEDGQTEREFTIQILPGDGSGAERRFSIGLFDPSSSARLGTNTLITVIIRGEEKPRGPLIFFWNNTLEVPRDSESVLFQIRRTVDGLPQTFFLETLQFNGEGAALPKVDYRPIRGYLTFKPDLVALTSMVKLIPNPTNRAVFKVFLLRISQADVGGIVPGGDFMTVILKDVGALSWKGPEVHQQTSVEVSHSVQTEIHQPPPPDLEFRGGAKVHHEQIEIPKCPAGQTFKKCQPTCQKKCGEGTPQVPHSCNLRGCIDGCFCPTGMLLDPASKKCVAPAQCPVFNCPPGLIFKECAPACPEVCPGLDFLDNNCHGSGCVKGCYCPRGLLLDNTLRNCVNPAHCPSASQAASGRATLTGGLTGGLPTGALQGQVQGGGGLLGGLLNG
ncbi:hypothetical protein JTE90_018268 [Oedothorax gibbosus]|uniref:Calx-beta domain-containing protein n=1 Tax=Oedothorax gibbosus TaxID=931172 RepID=A0AAV6UWU7_9ARAC|nr:hypothetical protein JTE90_018268 [Oedothorax gibbosus]